MKRLKLTAAVMMVLAPQPALADSFEIANKLGVVIGSEKYCGLKYTQPAIEAFIEKHVAADDMDFPGNLQGAVTLTRFNNKSQTESSKTAHCSQVRRLAKAYGFID